MKWATNFTQNKKYMEPKDDLCPCGICGEKEPNLRYLKLYLVGWEGVSACLDCCIALTEVAKNIKHACVKAKKRSYLEAKQKRDEEAKE